MRELMRKKICIIFIIFSVSTSLWANDYQVVATEFPPLMYTQNGKPAGFYYELLRMVLKEMPGAKVNVKFYPLPRMLKMIDKEPGNFTLGIAWSPERDKKYKWVGPSIRIRTYLYKLKKRRDIKVKNIKDLEGYKIGTGRGYAIEADLLRAGVPDKSIEVVTVDETNIKKLYSNRIDFVATADAVFWYLMRKTGHRYDEIEAVKVDKLSVKWNMYFVFNKSTDDRVIRKFQRALNRVKKTRKYKRLVRKYIPR